ncbi:MAG: hypothetical protein JXB04_10930, partial [Kiritimatiellae bacterium]|nr:hypothetical protein [Kiritimatiellia bacterium]
MSSRMASYPNARAKKTSPSAAAIITAVTLCLLSSAGHVAAQANNLLNGSFEQGAAGGSWTNATYWSSPQPTGGGLIGGTPGDAYDGTNYLRIYANGSSTRYIQQYRPVAAGLVYDTEVRLRSPSGANYFQPTNGCFEIQTRYYNITNGQAGAIVTSGRYYGGLPNTWTRYATGPALTPVGTVTGRTLVLYWGNGDTTTSGWIEVDGAVCYTTQPTKAGALLNPDFEVQPADVFTNVPFWTPLGNAGAVATNRSRSGRFALQVWWSEQLLVQTWPATAGTHYASSAYVLSPTNGLTPFQGTNAFGVVLLQFFNAVGAELITYQSDWITPTSSLKEVWVKLEAEGLAPSGTVTGRTALAILGKDDSMNGSLFFDDATQRVTSASDTSCGVINNPGFEDGIPGNCNYLSNDLPDWTWFGGTNAGFIATSQAKEGGQSLAIVYPNNLLAQDFAVTTGLSYIVQGYIYNPTVEGMTGAAYAVYLLEFYNGTNLVSVTETGHFTTNSSRDTWIKFAVTNRAPWTIPSGTVSGRVSCAILGSVTNFSGAIYFD